MYLGTKHYLLLSFDMCSFQRPQTKLETFFNPHQTVQGLWIFSKLNPQICPLVSHSFTPFAVLGYLCISITNIVMVGKHFAEL